MRHLLFGQVWDMRDVKDPRLMDVTRAKTADAWFAGRMNGSGSGLMIDFNYQASRDFAAGATLTPGREDLVFTVFWITESGGATGVDEDGALDIDRLNLAAIPATGQVVVTLAADDQLQVSVDRINFRCFPQSIEHANCYQ